MINQRITKAELIEMLTAQSSTLCATRSELARAEASIEAISANNDALREELRVAKSALDALSAKYIELQDRYTARTRDDLVIRDRAQLLAVARKLSSEGVPCSVRGSYLYHNVTKAILAQVGVNP